MLTPLRFKQLIQKNLSIVSPLNVKGLSPNDLPNILVVHNNMTLTSNSKSQLYFYVCLHMRT